MSFTGCQRGRWGWCVLQSRQAVAWRSSSGRNRQQNIITPAMSMAVAAIGSSSSSQKRQYAAYWQERAATTSRGLQMVHRISTCIMNLLNNANGCLNGWTKRRPSSRGLMLCRTESQCIGAIPGQGSNTGKLSRFLLIMLLAAAPTSSRFQFVCIAGSLLLFVAVLRDVHQNVRRSQRGH